MRFLQTAGPGELASAGSCRSPELTGGVCALSIRQIACRCRGHGAPCVLGRLNGSRSARLRSRRARLSRPASSCGPTLRQGFSPPGSAA